MLVHIQSYLLYVRMRFDQPDYSQSRAAVASGRCVFGMISSVTGQLWVKEGRESQRRLRFTLHFLPLAGRINPFTALLHEASIPMGHYPNKQALTLNAYWSQTDEFSVSACVARLCVSQAAADNPHVRYHYRSNAEYNQVFHFVISLFDW
ncbi:MAG: hypothetical protein ACJ8KF_06730 [Chthoniobacterales bacterium]